MNKSRWNYLLNRNSISKVLKYFLIAFGTIWLIIECPSALSKNFKEFVDKLDPFLLLIVVIISVLFATYQAFPRVTYTKKFKSVQTSISLKVGDLLKEEGNIVIGSSNYFDFDFNKVDGASIKSQVISKLFYNDVEQINKYVKESLRGEEHLAQRDDNKTQGNNLRYPIGTVAILPQANRSIFTVILTELTLEGDKKRTQSDPQILNKALTCLWRKIELEGRKRRFSIPVLGSGLANVNLSYLLIIQSIIISYAIFSRSSAISKEMVLVISPNDYNPDDFEEAVQFLNSIQI